MAILATEKVLTLDYWKPAYKVVPGDYVFDRKGNLVRVKIVQEFRSEDCWRIVFDDKLTISGDIRMEFPTEDEKYRDRARTYKGHFKFRRPLKYLSVEQLMEDPKASVPTCDPLKFPTQYPLIPPFAFGFWFVNRTKENKLSVREEYFDYVKKKFKDAGYEVNEQYSRYKNIKAFSLNPSIESQLKPAIPYDLPDNYVLASEEQRLELLRGIILAKPMQYSLDRDTFRITNKNIRVFGQLQALVESFGIKTHFFQNKLHKNTTMYFKTTYPLIPNQKPPRIRIHQGRRYIHEFVQLKPQNCVYIQTEGPDGTFLVGAGLITCR